jgi:type II secretory pathway pseudopilin PulG
MKSWRDISARRGGGFTLLELLIASILAIMVGAMTAQLWRYFSAQATNLSQRARAAQELKFALETLRSDMGAITWALPANEGRLLINKYTLSGQEALVEYYVDGGNLRRYDHVTGVSVPLASNVSGFYVENIEGSVLRVVVTVTCGQTDHQATLLWSTS